MATNMKPPKPGSQFGPPKTSPPAIARDPMPGVRPVAPTFARNEQRLPGTTPAMTGSQQSAWDYMNQLLSTYNLGSLANTMKGLVLGGASQSELYLALKDSDAYKQRFAGNQALISKGLNPLDEATYLSTENAYAQTLRMYGLPAGFYDDPTDFAKFIGDGVSPSELNQRAQMYADLASNESPDVKSVLQQLGVGPGGLAAYMMDPDRAMPLLTKGYNEALLGGALAGSNASLAQLGKLADLGVTQSQAASVMPGINQDAPQWGRLGDIYGDNISTNDLAMNALIGDPDTEHKMQRLASQERAQFSGDSGTAPGALKKSSAGTF